MEEVPQELISVLLACLRGAPAAPHFHAEVHCCDRALHREVPQDSVDWSTQALVGGRLGGAVGGFPLRS